VETLRFDDGVTTHALLTRPTDPAPSASAPYEERADWAERYVAWYLALTPRLADTPSDVDATHLYEIEFNSAVLDPREYERDTQVEVADEARFH
jgi:hypothetical protein